MLKIRSTLVFIAFLAACLVGWELIVDLHVVSPAALAKPSEILFAFPQLFSPSGNLADIYSTISLSLIAFLLSIPLGLLVGIAVAYSGQCSAPGLFMIDFMRSIPATALVPVFMIIFGIGDTAKVAVACFTSALAICISTIQGIRGCNKTRAGVAKTLGIAGFRRSLLIDIPESASHIFLGFRTGISLALILIVVSEMLIGANAGLGKVISDMRYTDNKALLYAALVITGIIGYSYNFLIDKIERTFVHWKGN